jgi:hypothetical protein
VARVERQNCKQAGTSPHIAPLAQGCHLAVGRDLAIRALRQALFPLAPETRIA